MKQDKRTTLSNILVMLGLLIMAVMAVTPLLVNHNINMEVMRWIYTAGALIVLVGRLINIYRGPSLRIKHLHVILIFSALLLLAGLVVQMYASWMIEREEKKGAN